MYCKNCGRELEDGAVVCNHCGYYNGEIEEKKYPKVVIVIIILVAIIVGVYSYFQKVERATIQQEKDEYYDDDDDWNGEDYDEYEDDYDEYDEEYGYGSDIDEYHLEEIYGFVKEWTINEINGSTPSYQAGYLRGDFPSLDDVHCSYSYESNGDIIYHFNFTVYAFSYSQPWNDKDVTVSATVIEDIDECTAYLSDINVY